ncbi:carboxypeptidase-like regulatory domain-containing protein [uncultured Lacinutrix sp.]|uniref:carboxypeptidase-like regulatory domain-containing protein n=1 Tax=uncultured Lacinutrix sp. TaxID=574032 RepID=UPI00262FC848|nr:carboxypeptidase-like regulatory domain-containing protein [uncultured Lacinutrix sp.]
MKTKKTTSKIILALMLMFSALFNSCEKNEGIDDFNNNNQNNQNDVIQSTLDQGANIQRDFMGRIVNESSLPLDNVNITIGNETAITDNNGIFIINNVTVKERQAFITAEKPGFLKGMRSIVPTQDTNMVNIMLITENLAGTVASGIASEVSLSNGTKVSFDGAFKDDNGNAYSGNVAVYMYHLDPANASVNELMPGSLQAENANEEERVLETYGMLNVELKGDAGQKLNIADGHVAEIELPLDPAQSGVAPSTIPLWHFDEVAGHWIEDGEANLIGGKYIGEVSHFSWWNCDAQFPTVTLCMTVVDNLNTPLSNVKVELWRSGATYPRIGYSNGNGEICGLIPSNETLTLKAYDQCGVEVHTTSIGPFSSDTNFGNLSMPGVLTEVITGNLVDCSNANVVNGYVNLTYGSQYATVAVSNGVFNMSVIKCASLNTFSLEGFDYDAFQTTTVLPFNFSSTNVGNIIACNAITEFVTIQVDNNPVEYYLTNIDAEANGSVLGYFNISSQSSNGNGFYVGGDSTVPGTYTAPNFWLESSTIDMNFNIPNNLVYTLNSFGAVSGYIDMTVTGTYTDTSGNIRNLSATIHVIRDN